MHEPRRSRSETTRSRYDIGSQSGEINNIGRDLRNYYDLDASGLSVLTRATGIARFLIVIGLLMALAGFGAFGYPILKALSDTSDSGPPDVTPWLPIGGCLMFVGIVVGNIGLLLVRSERR